MCRETALTRGSDFEGSQDVALINIFVNYIRTKGPCVVITTSIETLDRLWLYYYTSCMLGKAPRTKETLPNFCENMDPDKWFKTVWYRVTRNPQEFRRLTGCQ